MQGVTSLIKVFLIVNLTVFLFTEFPLVILCMIFFLLCSTAPLWALPCFHCDLLHFAVLLLWETCIRGVSLWGVLYIVGMSYPTFLKFWTKSNNETADKGKVQHRPVTLPACAVAALLFGTDTIIPQRDMLSLLGCTEMAFLQYSTSVCQYTVYIRFLSKLVLRMSYTTWPWGAVVRSGFLVVSVIWFPTCSLCFITLRCAFTVGTFIRAIKWHCWDYENQPLIK